MHKIKRFFHHPKALFFVSISLISLSGALYYTTIHLSAERQRSVGLAQEGEKVEIKLKDTNNLLTKTASDLEKLRNEDQFVRNNKLEDEIKNIQKTYKDAVTEYENLLKLKEQTAKVPEIDKLFADALTYLANRNYSSAAATLTVLKTSIQKKRDEVASSFSIPANVPVQNTPPETGYRRQTVDTPIGQYLIDIIAADLNSTRVIVDTASDGTCTNDCPVTSLGDYAARSGAFAGINGPYFCPADYPSCADKKNSFDTLIMNKNKTYFNSDNNVYSTVPAVIFSAGSSRFVGRSSDWGRDTGPDSVIAAQPMLVADGNIVFGGDGEPKRGTKGSRSFIGGSDNMAYIGVVYNATVAEVAYVVHTLGIKNALNLDSGGSTALWSSGRYLVGPGRNTPFGILFVGR